MYFNPKQLRTVFEAGLMAVTVVCYIGLTLNMVTLWQLVYRHNDFQQDRGRINIFFM